MVGAQSPQMEEEEGIKVIFPYRHKVAIALDHEGTVSEHLGSTPFFLVYTVQGGKVLEKETRQNEKTCSRLAKDTEAGCWKLMEELLPDVKVLISRGMGENAYAGLLRRDVLPIVNQEKDAERAIRSYLKGELRDCPHLVHSSRRRDRMDEGITLQKLRFRPKGERDQ